ncbi:tRNA pseudouridine(55) synthase TruB [[Mycoplasma] testudinis]|uniref:tRNA pseudouridine(55) synthase TruB n=1 Tax=[Mycoplasma] testudinis TaxID=33924 RepID=UPI000484D7F1|nr:tRNA pseudouridine(55) synthase TruB [[Mycoplasma] testudinis]
MSFDKIICFNKPRGMSSAATIARIKKSLNVKKIGYAGTLDPLASGVLLVGINKATKQLHQLTSLDKIYQVNILFGIETNTHDITGEVVRLNYCFPNQINLLQTIDDFTKNPYWQQPPQFSALKVNGVRAYKLARQNIPVNLSKRLVQVYWCRLLKFDLPNVSLEIKVSKGFYVRSFIIDLAKKLNTVATMQSLVRIACGDHNINQALSFKDFKTGNEYA